MNTKNNKRKKESVRKIQQAFVELIQTNDPKEITVTTICQLASINRSTFYANYIDVYDLVDKMKEQMIQDFKELYADEKQNKYNSNDFLKLFYHIKDNKIFYRTYFKLQFDVQFNTDIYDIHLAEKYYNNQYIDYHTTFFKAGITAIIKKWLESDCLFTPEEIFSIIQSEYKIKN